MVSVKRLIFILIGVLVVFFAFYTFPITYVQFFGEDIARKSAYKLTGEIASAINIVSANPQYTRMVVELEKTDCDVNLMPDKKYIETTSSFTPSYFSDQRVESTLGFFTTARFKAKNKIIACNPNKKKELIIEKKGDLVEVKERGWTGEACGGKGEFCCEGECLTGFDCGENGKCQRCGRYCKPVTCDGNWQAKLICKDDSCTTQGQCISVYDPIPRCTYKTRDMGCKNRECVAECHVDCEECG